MPLPAWPASTASVLISPSADAAVRIHATGTRREGAASVPSSQEVSTQIQA
jgi:hypothetical protein